MKVNYRDIYDKLYEVGYHDKGKNHGVKYAQIVIKKFKHKIGRLLEIGCSNGLAVRLFYRNGIDAYGLDASTIAIRYACDVNGVINCITGSVTDIPYKDRFFDSIFSCDVLEHLHPDDVELAMKEMMRICKRYFFVKVSGEIEHNREFMDKAKDVYGETFPDIDNLHLTVMPVKKWIMLFEKYDCQLIYEKNGMLVFERK